MLWATEVIRPLITIVCYLPTSLVNCSSLVQVYIICLDWVILFTCQAHLFLRRLVRKTYRLLLLIGCRLLLLEELRWRPVLLFILGGCILRNLDIIGLLWWIIWNIELWNLAWSTIVTLHYIASCFLHTFTVIGYLVTKLHCVCCSGSLWWDVSCFLP